VDYQTGGVRPVEEEAEILAFYPDLESDGPVRIRRIFDRLSENIAPTDWRTIAEEAVEAFTKGAVGVVIAHGTDTLGFTAAGLSFLLVDLPGPVVLVGAQRSPDRPSSDGASNLRAAVHVARHAELGEVVVVMHAGLSDDRFAIHRGTRVRKMHSSRRDAFQSRNSPPVGWLQEGSIHYSGPFRPPSGGPPRISGTTDGAAGILWTYPGLSPDRARASVRDLRGVVIAGTGLGHTATDHLPWIREATERGIIVVMTTQCLEGVVNPFVYATGRELLRAGVVYADDLLPETAFAKLVWALGQSSKPEEVCRLMLEDRAGEFEPRHRTEPGP
jgi:glutamyl-tRNA(Gln) amidotransferase subunit D